MSDIKRTPYAPDFIDVDLWDPSTFADGPPYEAFAQLRAEAPVAFHPEKPRREGKKPGPGFWCVTTHADIHEVSTNPDVYSSWLGGFTGADITGAVLEETRLNLMAQDPPDHTHLRRAVRDPFSSHGVAKLRSAVEGFARDTVDKIAHKNEIDFVDEVASDLPLLVLSHLMGVAPEDRGLFYGWTNAIIGNHDPDFGGTIADFLQAKDELFAYGRNIIENKRKNPGDDLVSTFVQAEINGEPLETETIIHLWFLLLIAGNETTRSSLTASMEALSAFPEQRELLLSDLPTHLPGFIEEVLRWGNPVLHFRRTASVDTQLGGAEIKAGDKLLLWYPSANRDATVLDNPHDFDLTRSPNMHLAFGVGQHFCLGARLGRMQIGIMLTELLTRLPDIAVSAPATRAHSNFLNSAKTLPVRFTPEAGH